MQLFHRVPIAPALLYGIDSKCYCISNGAYMLVAFSLIPLLEFLQLHYKKEISILESINNLPCC